MKFTCLLFLSLIVTMSWAALIPGTSLGVLLSHVDLLKMLGEHPMDESQRRFRTASQRESHILARRTSAFQYEVRFLGQGFETGFRHADKFPTGQTRTQAL
jgi:hypothetical protein